MNVFSYLDYREIFKTAVRERKLLEPGFGFHLLADAARIQRSYLSKVMTGKAQLNSDQMFLIANYLRYGDDEHEYVQLLLEHDRSSFAERKKLLAKKIRSIREARRDSSQHLAAKTVHAGGSDTTEMSDYYLDPLMQIVHIALSIDTFSKNPSALAAELHLNGTRLSTILEKLEKMGLIHRHGKHLRVFEPQLHLAKSSPLYRSWRNQITSLASQKINQLESQDFYSFSTVFSADASTRKILHERFLDYLKSCEATVKDADPKQVFQISFDLFPWTSKDP